MPLHSSPPIQFQRRRRHLDKIQTEKQPLQKLRLRRDFRPVDVGRQQTLAVAFRFGNRLAAVGSAVFKLAEHPIGAVAHGNVEPIRQLFLEQKIIDVGAEPVGVAVVIQKQAFQKTIAQITVGLRGVGRAVKTEFELEQLLVEQKPLTDDQGRTRRIGRHIGPRKTPVFIQPVENFNRRLQHEAHRAAVKQGFLFAHARVAQPLVAQITLQIGTVSVPHFVDLQIALAVIVKMKGHPLFVFVPHKLQVGHTAHVQRRFGDDGRAEFGFVDGGGVGAVLGGDAQRNRQKYK